MLAAEDFNTAATLFKAQKNWREAVECFVESAKCHACSDAHFLEGMQYEQAALILEKNIIDMERASATYKMASDACLTSGSPDKAIEMLSKGARYLMLSLLRCLEEVNRIMAYSFYQDALSTLEGEDRLRFGMDLYSKCISFCIKSEMLQKASETSNRLETAYRMLGKQQLLLRQILISILLYLAQGQEELAIDKYGQSTVQSGMAKSEECDCIQSLIQAYSSCEQTTLDDMIVNSKLISYFSYNTL